MQFEPPLLRSHWRCQQCRALLGIAREGHMEARYKTAVYRVRGEIAADCRRCGTANRIDTATLPCEGDRKANTAS